MKKILIISNTAFSIKKFREHYLNKSKNYKFKIYTPNIRVKPNTNTDNIETYSFSSKNLIHDFFKVLQIIKKENLRNIVVYSTYYSFLTIICKLFLKFNLIAIIAGRGSIFVKKNKIITLFYKKIFQFFLFFVNHIIFINPTDRIFFTEKTNLYKKSFLMPTEGVQIKNIEKKKNSKKNFIFFGRLITEKGINEYIKVAKIIKKKYPECNFYIAGPTDKNIIGQSKYILNTKFLFTKNKNFVNYLGFINNFEEILPKMDCLISPSFEEGAGTSVMEAMMCGLYVVAFKNSGHNFVLKDTDNFLCKNNNIQNLVDGVETFLDKNKFELNLIKKKSQHKIKKNFSSEVVSKKFENILNKTFGYKNKIAIINFYQTTENDSAYPRHIYLKEKLSDNFETEIFGCANNHYLFKKNKKDGSVNWLKSLNYRNSIFMRLLSLIIFNLKLILFNKSLRKKEYIYITDNISCYIFLIFKRFFRGKIIYEIRDIYPETLIELYNLNSFIIFCFKIIEKRVVMKSDYLVSSLNNYNKYLRIKNIYKNFYLIPNFFEKIKSFRNNTNFVYIGSITKATNINEMVSYFLSKYINVKYAKLTIVSKGELFNKYQKLYQKHRNIIFVEANNKAVINKYSKNQRFGLIGYYNKKVYNYGISPRKINFYISKNIIPIFLCNYNISKFYSDEMFTMNSKKMFNEKIDIINGSDKSNLLLKINHKIDKVNAINQDITNKFSNYLNE